MSRSADTIEEEILVLAVQAGSVAALDALVRRWLPIIRRHASRMTGDAAAVEDVVQEALLALVGTLTRLDDPARARAFMLGIVNHKAADWIRRRQRDRTLVHTIRDRLPRALSSDAVESAECIDRAGLIRSACGELPPELRAVVSLYYGEGLAIADIALTLGAPAGTIKSRLHDAREHLRPLLERIHP